jgi:hypothetical protein
LARGPGWPGGPAQPPISVVIPRDRGLPTQKLNGQPPTRRDNPSDRGFARESGGCLLRLGVGR